jgi:hypothetical protein
MTRWRYFLSGDTPELADEGKVGITRLAEGTPVSMAESVVRWGEWRPSDRMYRAKYLGSDYEFVEITAERAEELLRRWVEIGRLEKHPGEDSRITPELAEYLASRDREAEERWRDVPKPPGAEGIR